MSHVRLAFAALVLAFAAVALPARATTFLQVSTGGDTTCAVFLGVAYCWGYNASGQVGDNTLVAKNAPTPVVGLASAVATITTGGGHSCAVRLGAAYCWGDDDYGQLGNNAQVDSPVPVAVTGLGSGVTAISAGDLHTCAIQNGAVKCWGSNGYGQLGTGVSSFNSPVPVQVAGLTSGATAVSVGRNQSCAIASGSAYCWGRGDSGEMGNGTSTFINLAPVPVSGYGLVAAGIEGGGSFTCGVKSGAAQCWGFGSNGQLGNSFNNNALSPAQVTGLTSGVTAVTAGTGLHGCAIASGGLRCWGFNNKGQLGNVAAAGGTNAPVAVTNLASGVRQASAGGLHTCAVATGGLYCWGENINGQLGTGDNVPSGVPVLVIDAPIAVGLTATPASIDFGGQSVGTSSPSQAVAITNTGGVAITFTNAIATEGFGGTQACTTLAPGASCTLNAFFTPVAVGRTEGVAAFETNVGILMVELAGTGEGSLVTHYYRSILRRAPDAGGKSFWEGEATRMQANGVNVNETWYSMAGSFYGSSEYVAFNRDTAGFVTDLYTTFFNRAPDQAGIDFWAGQINAGLPREVALVSFMFSTEFVNFTQAIFGNTQTRREIDTIVDFYRGLLGRLPDNGGLGFWIQQFRVAQCQGAAAVNAQAESISSQFATSGEYAGRGRSNAQYVGDLYNAFLRRGGDLGGVQFWINSVASGAQTREQVRQQFLASPEFQARVAGVIAQGCL